MSQPFLVKTLAVAGMSLAGLFSSAMAAEYQIDPAHSEIVFRVKHMGISTVTGRFDKVEGSFDVDPKKLAATKGTAKIEVASINTNNEKRDGHLKGPDFFDAAKFPQITYTGKSVRKINMADTTCELVGDLTMHGVTKEIVLKVKGSGIIIDPWGNERAAFHAEGKIDRQEFGLKWSNLVESTGSLVVGNEVSLDLSFEGVRPAPAAATQETKKK